MKDLVTRRVRSSVVGKICGQQHTSVRSLKFGVGSIDTSCKGIKCQAARDIPSREGMIASMARGTIVYELFGRSFHLVNVYWDHGVDSLVSPQELVVTDLGLLWH